MVVGVAVVVVPELVVVCWIRLLYVVVLGVAIDVLSACGGGHCRNHCYCVCGCSACTVVVVAVGSVATGDVVAKGAAVGVLATWLAFVALVILDVVFVGWAFLV